MKIDLLAFGAHPDDVEIGCAGTILKYIDSGKSVVIVDLTKGELGTRGTPEIRKEEAKVAAKILGVKDRVNLEMEDSFFKLDADNQLKVIEIIRKYKPTIILTPAVFDRHPDHERAKQLITKACFIAGLQNVISEMDGKKQDMWRPKAIYHYIQAVNMEEDFVVDISSVIEQKMEAILAFKSQFYDPNSKETKTYISNPEFLDFVKARAIDMGHRIQVKYGEGFIKARSIGVENIGSLI